MSLREVPHGLLPPEGNVHGRSSLRRANAQPAASWKLESLGKERVMKHDENLTLGFQTPCEEV